MSANATELFVEMLTDIQSQRYRRAVLDPASPQRSETYEALPGRTYTLRCPELNVPTFRPIDRAWAVANVLHFFSDTEEAGSLRRYNRHADRFLTGDQWLGAYGAAAMPGVRRCIDLLRNQPDTRRAVVAMPSYDASVADRNRPACWTSLHFLAAGAGLDLLVYQRSLNLHGVMPYDCILLTNVLNYVAHHVGSRMHCLRWTIGSLHSLSLDRGAHGTAESILLPVDVLSKPGLCSSILDGSTPIASPYKEWLNAEATAS